MKEKDNPQNGWGKKKCLQMEIQGVHLQNIQTVHAAQLKKKWKTGPKIKMGISPEKVSREGIQVAIKYVKICSASLLIREMQIRSSMRYHFTPVSIATSKIRQ